MKPGRITIAAVAMTASLSLAGCHLPGRPAPGPEVPRPDAVMDFGTLYSQNCAGCHGANGQNGAATNLANPEYQALVDDATLHDVIANGEKGTLMPGFSPGSGGSLTDQQVDALVHGMRTHWSRANLFAGQNPPPYRSAQPGNSSDGQSVYAAACARCHGATAQQPGPAGSILDGAFLGLINEQTIRTTIIAGRPDTGHPDWRNLIPGRPMTDAEITDVSAWLLAQTPSNPGQPYPNTQPTTERSGEAQPKAAVKTQP
jgi:cytochrome c oxidase cbb3-type subunit III